jgi:small subunit ribosomal protein S16
MVKIRLRRTGAKKQPHYRVVVAESQSPRDGRFIETIGHYNPRTDPPTVEIDAERALYWLSVGAQPTPAVRRMLDKMGIMSQVSAVRKGQVSIDEILEELALAKKAEEAELAEAEAEKEAEPAEAEAEEAEEAEEAAPEAEEEEEAEEEAPEAEEAEEAEEAAPEAEEEEEAEEKAPEAEEEEEAEEEAPEAEEEEESDDLEDNEAADVAEDQPVEEDE